jgi:hypothetical protein
MQPVARLGPRGWLFSFGNGNGGAAPSAINSGSKNLHDSALGSRKN